MAAEMTPEQAGQFAGAAFHYVTQPDIWPGFVAWMMEDVNPGFPPEEASLRLRVAMSDAHDTLAPACPTPVGIV